MGKLYKINIGMCYFCVLFSKCVEDLFPLQIVYRGIYDWNWNHGIGKALSSLTVDSACFIYLLNLYLNFPFGCCFFSLFLLPYMLRFIASFSKTHNWLSHVVQLLVGCSISDRRYIIHFPI